MTIKRIAMCLRYDGSNYHGWQVQKGILTVQEVVENALRAVANHPIHTTCSGRTDTGVHATSQIIHFDTEAERSQRAWVFGTNSNLPPDISAVWAEEVPQDFHARFSATARRYRYVLYNDNTRPGILRNSVGWWYRQLDVEKMQLAANFLLGEHDFSSFRGAGCQSRSPVRNISWLQVRRVNNSMIIIEIKANAFLLHMVRNITGVLVAVGSGDKSFEWAGEVLQAQDRRKAGITMIPHGLYLVEVDYPERFSLPMVPLGPFFI